MKKKKVLPAVLEGKCPRCRKGIVFTHPLLNYRRFYSMKENCDVCNFHFEIEPGFFYGSMYVSYGFSVAIFLSTAFLLYFGFNDPGVLTYILTVTSISAFTYPINFRYSRIIFLYIFAGVIYDPSLAKVEST